MASRKNRKQRGWAPPEQPKSLYDIYDNAINMDDAPDELKISAKILNIMDPWIEEMDLVTLADCAVLAWNACVNGDDEYVCLDYLNSALDDRSGHARLIEKLKVRKKKMYPNDLRQIERIQILIDKNGDPKLYVTSSMQPGNVMKALERLMSEAKKGD